MKGCGGVMVIVMLCWYSDYCMDMMNNNVFCDDDVSCFLVLVNCWYGL